MMVSVLGVCMCGVRSTVGSIIGSTVGCSMVGVAVVILYSRRGFFWVECGVCTLYSTVHCIYRYVLGLYAYIYMYVCMYICMYICM